MKLKLKATQDRQQAQLNLPTEPLQMKSSNLSYGVWLQVPPWLFVKRRKTKPMKKTLGPFEFLDY